MSLLRKFFGREGKFGEKDKEKTLIVESEQTIAEDVALKNRIVQLGQSGEGSILRQLINELPEPTRQKSVFWLAENCNSSTVEMLSLLMYDEDPTIHRLASDALWKLLLSKATKDQLGMVEKATHSLDIQMCYAAFHGIIIGILVSVLGRELKPVEIGNVRKMIEEHLS